ncbi:MAG TPA: L-threonylcarbamoyladenylate synthase [Chryseosolibacter sp.]|nr:L-threonylcarbamoyladenylate synthase [Chryseosolibacter sp.]
MAEIGKDINKAKQLLAAGELVAIPTETVYGLAANALNVNAVTNIFQAKARPVFDPLIVHVPSFEKAKLYSRNIPAKAEILARQFWPGPLTLLLEKKESIPDLVTSGLPTAGFRAPNHPLTHGLLQSLDFPLAAPSANPFGYISPTTPQHVQDQLGDKISYILDGGRCEIGIESTIVGFDTEQPVVYRTGGLRIEDIENIAGKVKMEINTSSDPKSPGQLASHYAPRKKLILGNLNELLSQYASLHAGVISFSKDYRVPSQIILSPSGNLQEAARNLFSSLRLLDALPVDIILAEYVPNQGLGRAINDRLKRASH